MIRVYNGPEFISSTFRQWAQSHGVKLLRIDPAGKVCREIMMPVTRPTSCVFGQSDFSTLYVTSCAQDVDDQEALPAPNGSVYAITGLGRGVAESVFTGG